MEGTINAPEKASRLGLIALAVAMFIALSMAFGAGNAQAATYKLDPNNAYSVGLDKCSNHFSSVLTWNFVDAYGDDGYDNLELTNVKSSNTKVATVSNCDYYIMITVENIHKKGKATISWMIDGMKYSHQIAVVYSNPMAKFKCGGKNYLKKFKSTNTFNFSKKLKNKKVTVKAKSGWKIVEYSTFKGRMSKAKTKTFSKGVSSISAKINAAYPYNGIRITFKNTKTGLEQEINFEKAMGGGYSYVAG